jgi:hypothetical protein
VFVTAQGSAEARFWRGIATGRPAIAQSIAFELPKVRLVHALALVLLVRDVERKRYEAFASRFVAKLQAETTASLAELGIATAALSALGGPEAEAGARSLSGLLEALNERDAARVVDDWLDR